MSTADDAAKVAAPTVFVLVPLEPTPEMLKAACDEESRPLPMWSRMSAIWAAMLAAAPGAATPAPAPSQDTADAERWLWLARRIGGAVPMVRVQLMRRGQYVLIERDLESAIDAARAGQGKEAIK